MLRAGLVYIELSVVLNFYDKKKVRPGALINGKRGGI